jgi:hypothetical protein
VTTTCRRPEVMRACAYVASGFRKSEVLEPGAGCQSGFQPFRPLSSACPGKSRVFRVAVFGRQGAGSSFSLAGRMAQMLLYGFRR